MIAFQSTWGWQVALYLFLGGLGAGTFLAAGIWCVLRPQGQSKTIAVSFWVASACLAVGLLALLSELVKPERALLMWQSFSNGGSWMVYGAWGVLLALAAFVCAAWTMTRASPRISEPGSTPRTAIVVAGMPLALFVAFYTGMLMKAAEGVPFWDSWLLPLLFVASALSAGLNTVTIVAIATGSARTVPTSMRRGATLAILCIVAVEAVLLCLFVGEPLVRPAGEFVAQHAAARASAEALVSGVYALPFWSLVVACGLVVPFVLSGLSWFAEGRTAWMLLAVGGLLALVSDFALRFLVLFAGASADFVGAALATMFY